MRGLLGLGPLFHRYCGDRFNDDRNLAALNIVVGKFEFMVEKKLEN